MEYFQDDAGNLKLGASPIALQTQDGDDGQGDRKSAVSNPDLDPIIGLEKIRRIILDGMSKACFYGLTGIVHDFEIIELGPRRRGVRLSKINEVLAARTSPAGARLDTEARPAA